MVVKFVLHPLIYIQLGFYLAQYLVKWSRLCLTLAKIKGHSNLPRKKSIKLT
jgi:hypothetical protein